MIIVIRLINHHTPIRILQIMSQGMTHHHLPSFHPHLILRPMNSSIHLINTYQPRIRIQELSMTYTIRTKRFTPFLPGMESHLTSFQLIQH